MKGEVDDKRTLKGKGLAITINNNHRISIEFG